MWRTHYYMYFKRDLHAMTWQWTHNETKFIKFQCYNKCLLLTHPQLLGISGWKEPSLGQSMHSGTSIGSVLDSACLYRTAFPPIKEQFCPSVFQETQPHRRDWEGEKQATGRWLYLLSHRHWLKRLRKNRRKLNFNNEPFSESTFA